MVKRFKIEYDPNYINGYVVYRYEKLSWFGKSWLRISSHETEEQALEALKILVMFPKVFSGDTVDGIYNER